MNFANNLLVSISRRFALFLLISFGAISGALAQGPAGDLTITVQELENGDVEFSLSGSTTYKQMSGYPYRTPTNYMAMEPPHTLDDYENFTIPEGLVLTVPNNDMMIDDNNPGPPTREAPLRYLGFNSSGYWSFYSFWTGELFLGDEIRGSGSVVTNEVPFEYFVPGVYAIVGNEFDMTFIVRAYEPPSSPELKAPSMTVFPTTRVRKSSRVSRIRVRNVGDSPVEGLKVRVSGRGARDFLLRGGGGGSISPGGSIILRAKFRPRTAGKKRARVRLLSNAPTERFILTGKGLRPIGTTSPRFPQR